jgi:hypothetical protein
MSKKLNESALRSELTNSAFFDSQPPPKAGETAPVTMDVVEIAPAKLQSEPAPPRPLHSAEEDLNTVPYISQSFRITETELSWLRQQSFELTQRFGSRITQSTVLRVALHRLREACQKDTDKNPLLETVSRLKK